MRLLVIPAKAGIHARRTRHARAAGIQRLLDSCNDTGFPQGGNDGVSKPDPAGCGTNSCSSGPKPARACEPAGRESKQGKQSVLSLVVENVTLGGK